MQYSPHQLAYFAHKLTLRGAANSMDRMAGALLDAQVDLNPHQIDAALFATSNPLSKGVILADEVGLGKTIEAGLLIAQRWAERKRRILVIVPATSSPSIFPTGLDALSHLNPEKYKNSFKYNALQ